MTFEEINAVVAGSLPDYYEPLATTFFRNKVSQDGALVVFGNDTGANLCVDTTDGCVYAIAVTCKTPKRFVNTTFEKFLQFFKEYRPVADKIYGDEKTDSRTLARKLRERLTAIDEPAFGDSFKWWEPAVEQLVEG
jgi:hypothetical protein